MEKQRNYEKSHLKSGCAAILDSWYCPILFCALKQIVQHDIESVEQNRFKIKRLLQSTFDF